MGIISESLPAPACRPPILKQMSTSTSSGAEFTPASDVEELGRLINATLAINPANRPTNAQPVIDISYDLHSVGDVWGQPEEFLKEYEFIHQYVLFHLWLRFT